MSNFEDPGLARPIGRWFENTPWWLVSMGLHTVVLLGAALIYVERLMASDDGLPIILRREALPPAIPPVDPRDVFVHRGELKSESTSPGEALEPSLFDGFAPEERTIVCPNPIDPLDRWGQSTTFLSYLPDPGPSQRGPQAGRVALGTPEARGPGRPGGYSGRFRDPGGRGRGSRNDDRGESPATESAVLEALQWLTRHQDPDGGWSAEGFARRCSGEKCGGAGDPAYDTGVTGLAVLAFLGAGYTHLSRDEEDPAHPGRKIAFGRVVKEGVLWLTHHQDPEGAVGPRGPKHLYNHAIAALALCEAYGMTSSAPLRDPAQKAIEFLVASQNPGRGWRYSPRSGENDTSVTGWAVMALKSAEISDLPFPRTAYDGASRWLDEATEKHGYYRTGYTQAGTGKVVEVGRNEQFVDHPSMSAVAVMSRIFISKNAADPALGAATAIATDLPHWAPNEVDFYYWYYGSLALFQKDGPHGPLWTRWNEPMKQAIVPHQCTAHDGCRNGSWNPESDRWGAAGGRVYAAAINALTLEVYYRYATVLGGPKK